jgi:hypothetical protein
MARRLVGQVRTVAAAARGEYDARWEELRGAANALGAHAWRFHSTIHPDRYLEFLEFAADRDPRPDDRLAGRLLALDHAFGPADVEEWDELT